MTFNEISKGKKLKLRYQTLAHKPGERGRLTTLVKLL